MTVVFWCVLVKMPRARFVCVEDYNIGILGDVFHGWWCVDFLKLL